VLGNDEAVIWGAKQRWAGIYSRVCGCARPGPGALPILGMFCRSK